MVFSSPGAFERNRWTHIALVGNPADQSLTFYVNGEKDSQRWASGPFENCKGGFRIGAHKAGTRNFWTGMIDELYLFQGILDQDEINGLMNNQGTVTGDLIRKANTCPFIFPNPVKDVINISGTDACKRIVLYDARGSVILSGEDANHLNVEGCTPGYYMLHVEDEKGCVYRQSLIVASVN